MFRFLFQNIYMKVNQIQLNIRNLFEKLHLDFLDDNYPGITVMSR